MIKNKLSGIVLIGGESKRMGKPKAFINIEGEAFYERTAKLLAPFCDQVYISGKANQIDKIRDTSFEFITDKYDNIGPVAGILSAFDSLNDKIPAILVVATDMPFLSENLIQKLVKARDTQKRGTMFRDKNTGFLEPLCAIYEPSAYPILKKAIQNKEYAIRRIFTEKDLHFIDVDKMKELSNINYPEQLKDC